MSVYHQHQYSVWIQEIIYIPSGCSFERRNFYPLHKERESCSPSDARSDNFPGQYICHRMAFTRRTSWETKLSRFQKRISLKKRGRVVQRNQRIQVVTWKSCHFLNHVLSFSWCIRVLNCSIFLHNYLYSFFYSTLTRQLLKSTSFGLFPIHLFLHFTIFSIEFLKFFNNVFYFKRLFSAKSFSCAVFIGQH